MRAQADRVRSRARSRSASTRRPRPPSGPRPGTPIAGAALGRARCEAGFGHRLDGHLDAQVEGLAGTRVDDRDLAVGPDQVAADLLQRTLVALRPIRCTSARAPGAPGRLVRWSACRRSSVSARCEPRFEWATAWISSTITASTSAQHRPARGEVSIRYSDSGVVIRMSGGLRSIAARSRWGVSPVRIPRAPPRRRSRAAECGGCARCRTPGPSAGSRRRPAWRPRRS